jgi:hypothetical protein
LATAARFAEPEAPDEGRFLRVNLVVMVRAHTTAYIQPRSGSSSSGAFHAEVDPLDTELMPIVINTRFFVTRCGMQFPLAGGGLFEGGSVWVGRVGRPHRSPLFVLAGQRDVLREWGGGAGQRHEERRARWQRDVDGIDLVIQGRIRALLSFLSRFSVVVHNNKYGVVDHDGKGLTLAGS